MTAILRDFTCAVCGGPRQTLEASLVVLCRHCGAILTFAGDGQWHAMDERHAAGIQQLVRPSAAQARLMALGFELATTTDRARWRLLAEEQILLGPLVLPTDPQARAKHVKDALAMQEIATFDPRITSLMGAYGTAAMTLTQGEPVTAARAMLEAARAYYAALLSHPDAPPGVYREGAEHLAREMVRAAIGGYATLLGVHAIERIRTEVLGDKQAAAACPKCGGPLDPEGDGLVRCRQCEAVTRVTTDDAWLTAQLGIWKISRADLVRRNELDGPGPIIAAVGGFLWTSAATVPAASAAEFLRRAIPWVTTEALQNGLDILGHGADGDRRELLDGIRAELATWTPAPEQRPAPHIPVADFPPPAPEDEAAWIESALALHRYRGGPLMELLAQCLATMQVAAVHEQPVGLSPRAAVTFFERACPGYDRAEMLALLTPLIPGYDLPRVRAFTTELARLLSGAE